MSLFVYAAIKSTLITLSCFKYNVCFISPFVRGQSLRILHTALIDYKAYILSYIILAI